MNTKSIKTGVIAVLGAVVLLAARCQKPLPPKTLITASNNETMFVIPLQGENRENQAKLDSAAYYDQKKVAVKEHELQYRWLQTGRLENDGQWVPSETVIKVNRNPVTVEFPADDKVRADVKAISAESADSVGFTTGFSISALVEEPDTSTFLYHYPAGELTTVIKEEIRTRIQQDVSNFSAQYKLDDLRYRKNEMVKFTRDDVVSFYKTRGITVTAVGQYGGLNYINEKIQEAIDQVFIAQQQKETAAAGLAAVADINKKSELLAQQDRANAITIATGAAEAVRLNAEAIAKGNLLKAQADAAGIKAVADATKEAASNPLFLKVRELDVETRKIDKWSGSVPQIVVGSDSKTNLFMGLPGGGSTPATLVTDPTK